MMDLSTGIRLQPSEGGLLSKYIGEHPPKYNHLTPRRRWPPHPFCLASAEQGRPEGHRPSPGFSPPPLSPLGLQVSWQAWQT